MGIGSETSKDTILEFFTNVANKQDFSLDITLNVKGAVITGTLVSAREYFDTLSEMFDEGNEVAQMVSEQLGKAGESAQSEKGGGAHFIHMKETKVYCGNSKPTPSKGEFLWRGKLSEIDGFFLGRIHESGNK